MSSRDESGDDKGLPGAMVAAQARGGAAGAEASCAGGRCRRSIRARCRRRRRAREVEFDLSSLPKLEELTGTTDITAFSALKGVPEHLPQRGLAKILGRWILRSAITSQSRARIRLLDSEYTAGALRDRRTRRGLRPRARMVSQIMGGEPSDPPTTAANPAKCASSERSRAPPSRTPCRRKAGTPDLPAHALRRSEETGF